MGDFEVSDEKLKIKNANLLSINISSIKTLENECFNNCTFLQSLSISTSVTNIGDNCFEYCASLTTISFS
jgi:hypothetical protein